jgi:hypothetical protein
MARERADFSLALSPDRLSFHGFTWLARVFSVLELVERAGQMDAGAIFRSEHRDHPLGLGVIGCSQARLFPAFVGYKNGRLVGLLSRNF